MKKIVLTSIFVLITLLGMAQQDAHFTQFMFNKLVINPAYAGSREAMSATALYRHQWFGIDGAPRTSTFSFNAPFLKNNSGIGLSVLFDKIGISETWFVDLSYAYKLRIDEKNTVNIGLVGRLEHLGVRWDMADPLNPGDVNIPEAQPNKFLPDFGLGVYYYNPKFYVGFSVPHLLKNELYTNDDSDPNATRYYANQRHLYLMAGTVIKLKPGILMKPAILLKHQAQSPFDMDVNLSFLFLDALWVGASYRLGDSVDGIIQYQFSPQFKIGVGYDYPISDIRSYSPGSLEVMVDYLFKYDNEQIKNIRYF